MDTLTRGSVSAVVEYDYTAKEPDELDLIKGAIIQNIKVQAGGWWEGTLVSNGKTGMFPDNFVRLLEGDDKSPVVLRDRTATANRRCKVVYSYTQHNDDELSLVVGNIIEVLGEVEEGWWRGKIGDKVGVFPSNFVVPIESSPILNNRRPSSTRKEARSSIHGSKENLLSSSPSNFEKDAPLLPPKPVREYCRVQYPYEPQNEDELELRVGDLITVVSKELPDKGWWKGELRGKLGVFPDNFVVLLPPEVSPSKDSNHGDRTQTGSSKVFIKKSGSGSSSQGSTRKDSFGSRDSLNDILSETGIVSGNVAAQRKSLENKNIELTVHNDIRIRRSLESKTSDVRKSMENIDEKKTPPPVLSKKPQVPIKKQTTVTSVAGNLLSGLKQKVKSVEHKLTAHDSLDGLGSSKIHSNVADNNDRNLVGEKFKKEDSDFDTIERGSMLQDMRASRVKAPKRRPPSQAPNVASESNNNNLIYLNGGGTYIEVSNTEQRGESSANELEELAKPKPREWEKRKAPWMAELKANQARKTSPNVEPRVAERKSESEDTSKIITQDKSDTSSKTTNSNYTSQQRKASESTLEIKISGYEQTGKKENNNDMTKSTSAIPSKMTASISTDSTSATASTSSMTSTTAPIAALVDDVKIRPTSLSIRNRSISPNNRTSLGKTATNTTSAAATTTVVTTGTSASVEIAPHAPTTTDATSSTVIVSSPELVTKTKLTNCILPPPPVDSENICDRVTELEQRVIKLEALVESQSIIIKELVHSLKEENDKVKGLKTELEKYAQCVTQV